jgi:hypothetical protein
LAAPRIFARHVFLARLSLDLITRKAGFLPQA